MSLLLAALLLSKLVGNVIIAQIKELNLYNSSNLFYFTDVIANCTKGYSTYYILLEGYNKEVKELLFTKYKYKLNVQFH